MIIDEPAMWNLIPASKRDRVLCAAKAMCSSRDADDDLWHDGEGRDDCTGCDTPAGGSCVAFGLYGGMALAVVEALDQLPTPGADHG